MTIEPNNPLTASQTIPKRDSKLEHPTQNLERELQPQARIELDSFNQFCLDVEQNIPINPDYEKRYKILTQKSIGRVSIIMRARDRVLHRDVAIKSLQSCVGNKPEEKKAFLREACLNVRLDHRGIPPVYALERDALGEWHIVMKLIEGDSLRTKLDNLTNVKLDKKNKRELRLELLEKFCRLCDILAYAHNLGVVHNHISLDTILISNENVTYLMDWSCAELFPHLTLEKSKNDLQALHRMLSHIVALKTDSEMDGDNQLLDRKIIGILKKSNIHSEAPNHSYYQTVEELKNDVTHYLQNEDVTAAPNHFLHNLSHFILKYKLLILSIMILLTFASMVFMKKSQNLIHTELQAQQTEELTKLALQTDTQQLARATDLHYIKIFYKVQKYVDDITLHTKYSKNERKFSNTDYLSEKSRPKDFRQTLLFSDPVSLEQGVMIRKGETPATLISTAEFARIARKTLLQSDNPSDDTTQPHYIERLMVEWADGTRYSFPGRYESTDAPNHTYRWPEKLPSSGWSTPYLENNKPLITHFVPLNTKSIAYVSLELHLEEIHKTLVLESLNHPNREYFVMDSYVITTFYNGLTRTLATKSKLGIHYDEFIKIQNETKNSLQRIFALKINQMTYMLCAIPLEYNKETIVGQILAENALKDLYQNSLKN